MQIAIAIDIAFIVVVFLFLDLISIYIESGRSLLEFRDPLTLLPKTENVSADENWEASNASPIKRREGG